MAPRPDRLEQPDLTSNARTAPDTWNLRNPFSALTKNRLMERVAKEAFGEHFHFMMANPYFHDDIDQNHSWKPIRVVGSGSFGVVGLWQKRTDDKDDLVDEIAIKEQDRKPGQDQDPRVNEIYEVVNAPWLLREAVVQHDLVSGQGAKNVVPLRRYKAFEAQKKAHPDEYRIWDTYPPELWLWSVLRDLLEAAVAMEQEPPPQSMEQPNLPNMDNRDKTSKYFTIHVDLKPHNVLLDYCPSDSNDPLAQYPRVMLADFGQTRYVRDGRDTTNPGKLWPIGTPAYDPPEKGAYGVQWERIPIGIPGKQFLEPNKDAKAFRWYQNHDQVWLNHKWNVFGIGKIMFELMTLGTNLDLYQWMTQNEREYWSNHTDFIDNEGHTHPRGHGFRRDRFVTGRTPEYDKDLLSIVWDLLQPDPTRRPMASSILAFLNIGTLNTKVQDIVNTRPEGARDTPGPAEKLYFEANTINEMPQGNAGRLIAPEEERYILAAQDRDPDWPMLVPPNGPKWNQFKQTHQLSTARGERHYEIDGVVYFGDPKGHGGGVRSDDSRAYACGVTTSWGPAEGAQGMEEEGDGVKVDARGQEAEFWEGCMERADSETSVGCVACART